MPMAGEAPRVQLIHGLGDPRLSVRQHHDAYALLGRMQDVHLIPALIDSPDDNRVFDPAVRPRNGTAWARQ
jgi:hypothetical protein